MSEGLDERMKSCNSIRGDYINTVYRYLKGLAPDSKVEIASVSKNPKAFIEAVKFIMDLHMLELSFSNDYKYIIRKEEVNYDEHTGNKRVRSSGNTETA